MKSKLLGAVALAAALALIGWLAGWQERLFLVSTAVTSLVLYLWGAGIARVWLALRRRHYQHLTSLLGLIAGLGAYLWLCVWVLRPDLLPRRVWYDLIANRHVTERLVDPALLKVERWEILGQEREVLFVHPASSGSTALVYPVRVEPRAALQTELAIAPEAWNAEGDGVTFAVYLEDDAGIHMLYSRYVDPKHHQDDKRWLPVYIDLTRFEGKLARIILVVNSGPAGDRRYDWAGWGEPRLTRPVFP